MHGITLITGEQKPRKDFSTLTLEDLEVADRKVRQCNDFLKYKI
jgi:hypothetical protein